MSSKDHCEKSASDDAHHPNHERSGAKQPEAFDPGRAALLDDRQRFEYVPPSLILTLLDAPKGGTLIDFGTGTGTYAIELAEQRADLTIIALDEQPRMLDMLRAKPAANRLKNLKPLLTDRVDSIAGTADRILALNVLHELGDKAIKEMLWLLKAEGAILFIDWEADVERPVGPPKGHTYRAADAQKRLEGFGLAVETLSPLRYHFVLRARIARRHSQ